MLANAYGIIQMAENQSISSSFSSHLQNLADLQRVEADGEAAVVHLAAVAAYLLLRPRARADPRQRHLVPPRAARGRLPPPHEGGQHARLPGQCQ